MRTQRVQRAESVAKVADGEKEEEKERAGDEQVEEGNAAEAMNETEEENKGRRLATRPRSGRASRGRLSDRRGTTLEKSALRDIAPRKVASARGGGGRGENTASLSPPPARTSRSRTSTPASATPNAKQGRGTSPAHGERKTGAASTTRKRAVPAPKKASVSSSVDVPPLHVTAAERHAIGIGLQIDREDHATKDDPAYASWTQAERDLFNRFADRGAVAILPKSWKLDFSTMPDELFTDDDSQAFINAHSGKDFQAMKALASLFGVGARVRDRLIAGGDPTKVLQLAVSAYNRWCIQDGGLEDEIIRPVFTTVGTRAGETTGDVVSRITHEFRAMAAEHYSNDDADEPKDDNDDEDDKLRRKRRRTTATTTPSPEPAKLRTKSARPQSMPPPPPPPPPPAWAIRQYDESLTLYGAIVAKSVLAVVTFDTGDAQAETKTIALFDFADDGQDVWNAFAVAILLVTVRNYLTGSGERSSRKRSAVGADPDA